MRAALVALAVTAVLIAVISAAPWRSLHPNHVFIFELLQNLEHDDVPLTEVQQR